MDWITALCAVVWGCALCALCAIAGELRSDGYKWQSHVAYVAGVALSAGALLIVSL